MVGSAFSAAIGSAPIGRTPPPGRPLQRLPNTWSSSSASAWCGGAGKLLARHVRVGWQPPSCSWFRRGLEVLAGGIFVGLLVLGAPDVVDASIWPVSFCWQ
jgi:hypothetical protein